MMFLIHGRRSKAALLDFETSGKLPSERGRAARERDREELEAALRRVESVIDEASKLRCRECGCTDEDCAQCIAKLGEPCQWVEADLCSACVPKRRPKRKRRSKRKPVTN